MSTVDGIGRILAAAGVGDYATDRDLDDALTPITVGSWPAGEGAAVVVTTYPGGPAPDSRNGWEYPRVQVKVRHADPLEALALDRACFEALQFTPTGPRPRTLPGSTAWLADCHALQSEAQPLGADGNGRHEFSRNYQLTIEP